MKEPLGRSSWQRAREQRQHFEGAPARIMATLCASQKSSQQLAGQAMHQPELLLLEQLRLQTAAAVRRKDTSAAEAGQAQQAASCTAARLQRQRKRSKHSGDAQIAGYAIRRMHTCPTTCRSGQGLPVLRLLRTCAAAEAIRTSAATKCVCA